MNTEMRTFILLLLSSMCLIFTSSSSSLDTITESSSLKDGDTIVSKGGNFEFGFFSPVKNSPKRYLGIWYSKISNGTVIWVANRDSPLFNSSGIVKITDRKILALFGGNNRAIWSSNSSESTNDTVVAQLLDTGNLVLRSVSRFSIYTITRRTHGNVSNGILGSQNPYSDICFAEYKFYGIRIPGELSRISIL